MSADSLLAATSTIVSAYLINNPVESRDLTSLIKAVYRTLALDQISIERITSAGQASEITQTKIWKGLSASELVTEDFVICAECGFAGKVLKGHISTSHGLTLDEYRAKYNLAADHPVTAPSYSQRRAALAIGSGLGRNGRSSVWPKKAAA